MRIERARTSAALLKSKQETRCRSQSVGILRVASPSTSCGREIDDESEDGLCRHPFLKQCSDLSGGLVGAFDVACVVATFLRQFAELEVEGGPLVVGHGSLSHERMTEHHPCRADAASVVVAVARPCKIAS